MRSAAPAAMALPFKKVKPHGQTRGTFRYARGAES